jgi:hypothetical protein
MTDWAACAADGFVTLPVSARLLHQDSTKPALRRQPDAQDPAVMDEFSQTGNDF